MLSVNFSVLWACLSFVAGAIPFAVWLGRLAGVDPRTVGDGNPGATNAWKAGGWQLGLPVLFLDFFKGALPVGLAAQVWGWTGAMLVAVALAPILGHDFSPFLRGRGGKGLATTFGVWTGLTLAEGPLILGLSLLLLKRAGLRDGWVILVGNFILLADLLVRSRPPALLAVWLGASALLAWKYRSDLMQPWRRSLP